MSKYTHIEKALGLAENQELAVDSLEGFYCNGPLAQQMDENLAKAQQDALTAEANIAALAKANDTIASLNTQVEELKQAAADKQQETENKAKEVEEANQKIADLNAKVVDLEAQIESLKSQAAETEETAGKSEAEHAEALQGKDAEIEALKSQLAEKESEIEELSKNAPKTPAPAPAGQEEEMEKQAPHHFYKPGMTAEEGRQALAKRKAELRAKF